MILLKKLLIAHLTGVASLQQAQARAQQPASDDLILSTVAAVVYRVITQRKATLAKQDEHDNLGRYTNNNCTELFLGSTLVRREPAAGPQCPALIQPEYRSHQTCNIERRRGVKSGQYHQFTNLSNDQMLLLLKT